MATHGAENWRELAGKTVLIVDSCTQIGAESARLLSSLGCSVALASSDKEGLESQSAELHVESTSEQNKTVTFPVDFRDDKSIEAMINDVIVTFKELNVFVYASGPLKEDSIESFKMEDLDAQFHRNVRTPLLLTKLVSPYLIRTKGCIVNVCSIMGYRPFPQALTYGSAMKALIHLTSNAASELASKGVRVNAIVPGAIDEHSAEEKDVTTNPKYKEFQDYNSKCHPIGRLGTREEFARAILFLVSSQSSYTTGEILTVDGGRHVLDRDV